MTLGWSVLWESSVSGPFSETLLWMVLLGPIVTGPVMSVWGPTVVDGWMDAAGSMMAEGCMLGLSVCC